MNKREVQLSTSQRARLALEIATLINTVTKLQIPVYIDNVESITRYKDPGTQVIEARVKEGHLLTVNQKQ